MAKIDVSGIENFDTMSAEDQVKALLGFEFDDGAAKIKEIEEKAAKQKAALDKATSEAAGYKKQLNEHLSDEERAKQENESTLKALQDELAELKKREEISKTTAMFLSNGFDETVSADAADAFFSKDIEKMSGALKKYRESIETQIKAKLIGGTPKPESGNHDDDGKGGGDSTNNIAAMLGKARAEQQKMSRDILDKYTKR